VATETSHHTRHWWIQKERTGEPDEDALAFNSFWGPRTKAASINFRTLTVVEAGRQE